MTAVNFFKALWKTQSRKSARRRSLSGRRYTRGLIFERFEERRVLAGEPTSLIQTGSTATSIDMSWTDNSDDETRFHIERSPDGSTWGEIGTTAANDNTFTDSGGVLACGQSWYFQVRAESSGVYSDYSNTLLASTAPCVPVVSANGPYTVEAGRNCAYTPNAPLLEACP